MTEGQGTGEITDLVPVLKASLREQFWVAWDNVIEAKARHKAADKERKNAWFAMRDASDKLAELSQALGMDEPFRVGGDR